MEERDLVDVVRWSFTAAGYKADPYRAYAWLRREAPVARTRLPTGEEVYLVSHYADVVVGLKDGRLVKDIAHARPGTANDDGARLLAHSNMLKVDPPEHTRLRALAHAAFTPRFVNQMRGHIQQIADDLIDRIMGQGEMDLIDAYAFPLPITVICEMLGVPTRDAPLFREWSSALIASGALSSEAPIFIPEALQLAQYLAALIAERRAAPKDDLISALLAAREQGDSLNDAELLGTTLLLLVAGHETTVNLIGNGTFALLQHREQWEALRADPSLVRAAVEELLRLVNPVQLVNRYASEDLIIAGVSIPKGSHLLLLVASANHDSAFTERPEDLDISRGAKQHVAFGQGIHYCLGAPLARLEGEIALATLLRRLPNLRLAIAPDSVVWRPAVELRGLSALPVTF